MYQPKYLAKKRKKSHKPIILPIALLVLLLGVGIGGVVAFLTSATDPVTNTFTPSQVKTEVVERFADGTKSNVCIRNTGDTTAWIRAAVVVTWQDEAGNVYGQTPVAGSDYTITFDLANGWIEGDDGFYYYTRPVKSEAENSENCTTGVLITSCAYKANAPEGYALCVEILSSGLQFRPAAVFDNNWASSGLKVSDDGNSLVKNGGAPG